MSGGAAFIISRRAVARKRVPQHFFLVFFPAVWYSIKLYTNTKN